MSAVLAEASNRLARIALDDTPRLYIQAARAGKAAMPRGGNTMRLVRFAILLGIGTLPTALAAQEATTVERANFYTNQQAFVYSDRASLDVDRHINVGDVFYAHRRYIALANVVVDEDRVFQTENGTVTVARGQILRGISQEYVDLSFPFCTEGKTFVRDGKPRSVAHFTDSDSDGRLDTVTTSNFMAKSLPISEPIHYHFAAYQAAPDFVWTLTYLGTAGGILRLAYRETSNDVARPAFANDLSFPATIGKVSVIRFKNLAITIKPESDGSLNVRVSHTTAP